MIANTANAILELFDRCKDNLPIEQLDWLDGMTDHAANEASNLMQTLTALAMVHGHKESASVLPGKQSLSEMLYGLADRAGTIDALIRVGSEAAYLANEKRQGQREGSSRTANPSSKEATHGEQ